jgi:carboxymethylenebutenolidase
VSDRTVLPEGVPLHTAGDPHAPTAVIVVQEAFGVNDHIEDVTRRFADRGHFAVAPELFHRAGSPIIAYDDLPGAMAQLGLLTRDGLTEDLLATTNHLHRRGFHRANIAIVGYCMGGAVALFADTLGLVGAAVTYYGGGVTTGRFGLAPLVELAPSLTAPWLGLYGDRDPSIPVEQVEALGEAAARAPVETQIVRYHHGQHGFHCDARPAVYDETAAADAARRTYEFLDRVLVAR